MTDETIDTTGEDEAAPILVETKHDLLSENGGKPYEQRWYCEPPAAGVEVRVVREEWSADFNVRSIYEVEIDSADDEPTPIEKSPGECRFADCTTTATQLPDIALSDDETAPVELCGPHAGMVRKGRLPESLRGTAVAADGTVVVGLATPEESPAGEVEQVAVPVFFPYHPADGATPMLVRAQPGPQGGMVTLETPLHPGELQIYSLKAAALLIRQLQTELRKATMMPAPVPQPQHPMAQGPIVGGGG